MYPGQSHDEAKLQQFLLKHMFIDTKPFSAGFVIGKEGARFSSNAGQTGTGCPVLGTYAAAVVIKLKSTTNTYEAIAEEGMR